MKTDNSYFGEKVLLRLDALPDRDDVTVLDCYRGEGLLWAEVARRSDKKITVVGIEKDRDKAGPLCLVGDNLKFLGSMDLARYDIIDLDAYGVPFRQMNILFRRGYRGIVIVTFVQIWKGGLHRSLLYDLGYSQDMVRKIPTMFCRDGLTKITQYLAKHGVTRVRGYYEMPGKTINRPRSYFYYRME